MSIIAYTGLPGSGKSYSVVRYAILPSLKQGRKIYTNIPLNMDIIKLDYPDADVVYYDSNKPIDDPDFFTKIPAGAIIIIDECMKYFKQGSKPTDYTSEQLEFFSMHRHRSNEKGLSQEIILCCQDMSQVAKWLRDLVEQTSITTKLDMLGMKNKFKVNLYHGAVTGKVGQKANFIGHSIGKYSKDIYKYYSSHTQTKNKSSVVAEVKPDTRGNIFKSKGFIIGALCSVFLIPYGIYGAVSFFDPESHINNYQTNDNKNDDKPADHNQSKPKRVKIPVSSSNIKTKKVVSDDVKQNEVIKKATDPINPIPKATVTKTNESEKWRLSGHYTISGTDQKIAILESKSGHVKEIDFHQHCVQKYLKDECRLDGKIITNHTGSHYKPQYKMNISQRNGA